MASKSSTTTTILVVTVLLLILFVIIVLPTLLLFILSLQEHPFHHTTLRYSSYISTGSSSTGSTYSINQKSTIATTTNNNNNNNNNEDVLLHHSCLDEDPIRQQCYMFPPIMDITTTTLTVSTTTVTNSTSQQTAQQQQQHVPSQPQQQQHWTTYHRRLVDFILGKLSDIPNTDNIRLSQGLVAKVIAQSGQRVSYTSTVSKRSKSTIPFHQLPDGADVFTLNETTGTYVYLSNAERILPFFGGVYGITFDKDHNVIQYESYIRRTTRNCNGGRTPWDTWVTCEEAYLPGGYCWQIDPTKQRTPQKIYMSSSSGRSFFGGGSYEAFAYDVRDGKDVSFYITEDSSDGTLRRYRPVSNTPMGWDMLHQSDGILDFLVLNPSTKTFLWTTDISLGRQSANAYYRNSEGIAINNGTLAFVSKVEKKLFLLDLDQFTYTEVSTLTPTLPGGGSFDAQPDHVISYATQSYGNLLILTEDGGTTPGLFAYDGTEYLSYFESNYNGDEVTGIAFSPDGTKMYVCVQDVGLLFQISRDDNQPFTNRRTLKWRKGLKL